MVIIEVDVNTPWVRGTFAKKKRHPMSFFGRRCYASGTKKLLASYPERNETLAKLQRSTRYPLLANRSPSIPVDRIQSIVKQYQDIEHEQQPQTPLYEIRGRINNVRYAGKGLIFLDLIEGRSQIQVVMNAKKLGKPLEDSEKQMHELIRRGDSVSAIGRPWRTRAGELSILSTEAIKMLSPSLHPLPDTSAGRAIRKHNRVAELKAFEDAKDVLRARSLIVTAISDFLQKRDFLMVTTPHLSAQKGGASANTFDTRLEDGRALHLRVAPELWLKRLIIGGFDRVFEIGYSYRNEGIDATHNPEFTTCEFYMSFADLNALKVLTHDMLVYVATQVREQFPKFSDNCSVILSPWKTIDFVHEIEKKINGPLKFDLTYLRGLCDAASLETSPGDDVAKLLDKLAAHYIEPQCEMPTFVENHPSIMAPLAKDFNRNEMILSKRFELFIGGREYVNAYEEENDPSVQLEKLSIQDPSIPDRSFVEALEWGLPPTGGWGLGIDRLTMLLTGSERINDVLSFGDLNQVRRL